MPRWGGGGGLYRLIRLHYLVCLSDTDAKYAQEDIPQVETQLIADMRQYVRRCPLVLVGLFFVGQVYSQAFLLVGI